MWHAQTSAHPPKKKKKKLLKNDGKFCLMSDLINIMLKTFPF